MPAKPEHRTWAVAIVAVSALFFLAAAPFARTPLAPVQAFIPAYQSALIAGDLITATLLLGQLLYSRSRALLVLACGYLFAGLVATAHLLTFPGLFAPGGLLGAGPQSTAWIYMFWHGAFPAFVIAYACVQGEFRSRHAVPAALGATVAGALLAILLAIAGHTALPPIMSGNAYTPLMIAVVGVVWGSSLAAFAFLWRREARTVLDLWLMVVMWAWMFDIALSAVLNAGRFDLGFYAGRLYGLLASSLVLIVLLVENARLYRQLRDNNRQLEAARQQALAAERAKGEFLATMSHEIRTPMTGVMGMLELLSLTRLKPEQRTTLEVVRESGRSLLRIVDDVLDFSRMEAGKLELRPEPTSIAAVVDRVQAVYAGNAASKGISLTRTVDDRIGPALVVDPMRLAQVLNNLVSNAVKFTAEGSVAIRAELVERLGNERDVVRFVVEDTGMGMEAQEKERLFERFTQVGPIQSSGSGLGLSICRRLADLMDGLLALESRPGAGTKVSFTLQLPIAPPGSLRVAQPHAEPADAATARDLAPGLEEARHAGSLILVVDDHPVNRMVLAKQLNSLGYATQTASNGMEAVARWDGGGFGAIITDVRMPEMNGFDLARHIRECEARRGSPRIPIIACTAGTLGGEAAECLVAGMDDYLAKPVLLADLRRKLDQWLPSAGPLERETIAEITRGVAGKEREMLVQFRRYAVEDARDLRAAVESGRPELVIEAAHRIKGASRAIGATALTEACERLEQDARACDRPAMRGAMAAFERELARLEAHIAVLEAAP